MQVHCVEDKWGEYIGVNENDKGFIRKKNQVWIYMTMSKIAAKLI